MENNPNFSELLSTVKEVHDRFGTWGQQNYNQAYQIMQEELRESRDEAFEHSKEPLLDEFWDLVVTMIGVVASVQPHVTHDDYTRALNRVLLKNRAKNPQTHVVDPHTMKWRRRSNPSTD